MGLVLPQHSPAQSPIVGVHVIDSYISTSSSHSSDEERRRPPIGLGTRGSRGTPHKCRSRHWPLSRAPSTPLIPSRTSPSLRASTEYSSIRRITSHGEPPRPPPSPTEKSPSLSFCSLLHRYCALNCCPSRVCSAPRFQLSASQQYMPRHS